MHRGHTAKIVVQSQEIVVICSSNSGQKSYNLDPRDVTNVAKDQSHNRSWQNNVH